MSIGRCLCWCLAALLLVHDDAAGICLPKPYYRYVGDTASDGNCTDNDIQSAINNTTCPTTIVVITREHTYTQQALDIGGKSVTLAGVGDGVLCGSAPVNCDPDIGCGGGGGGAPPAPAVTTQKNSSASVLYIHGNSNVTLQSLELTGGGGTDYGGGIHFSGTGSLTLIDATITGNSAVYGGGIQFNGSGGAATLTLGAGTIIDVNTASANGGGIHVDGTARLFAQKAYTVINSNHAPNGNGGGIAVVGPARADIGSPGYNGLPVIFFNDAVNGGGAAVLEDGHGEAVLRTFAHDLAQPTIIAENNATTNGGGIYLEGLSDVCLFAPRIEHNIAEEGAAIYKTGSGGIYINGAPNRLGSDCGPESIGDLGGARDCWYNEHCNAIRENQTQHADSTPSAGSIIYHFVGELVGSRFRLQHNIAAYAIRDQYAGTIVSRCLLSDNSISAALIHSFFWGSGVIQFNECTFAHNAIDGGYVFEFLQQAFVSLTDDIITEPGHLSVNFTPIHAGDDISVGYTMSNDISTLPHAGNPSVVQDDPHFVDVGAGDYHLRNDSPALDFAPTLYDQSLDLALGSFDLVDVVNRFGPADLGAYELISTDRIFANGYGDAMPPLDCSEHCD